MPTPVVVPVRFAIEKGRSVGFDRIIGQGTLAFLLMVLILLRLLWGGSLSFGDASFQGNPVHIRLS